MMGLIAGERDGDDKLSDGICKQSIAFFYESP